MNDAGKTTEQLIGELAELRQQSESLQFFKGLVEHIQIGVTVCVREDPDDLGSFRFVFRNSAAARITQVPDELVLGKTIREGFPDFLETEGPQAFADAIRTGQVQDLPDFHYGNEIVPKGIFSVKVVPLGGEVVAQFFENITQRKQAEEAL